MSTNANDQLVMYQTLKVKAICLKLLTSHVHIVYIGGPDIIVR